MRSTVEGSVFYVLLLNYIIFWTVRSTVEGSEAVRPNEFYAVRAIIILQLEVSAIADDPLPASGSFPPFRGTQYL